MSKIGRTLFHWRYSQIVLPGVFALGVALATSSNYNFAYIAFIAGGVWGVFFWLNSDFIFRKERSLRRLSTAKKYAAEYAKLGQLLDGWKWSGSSLICALVMVCCGYNYYLKDDAEHSDVLLHLDAKLLLPQGSSEMNSKFTITNNSARAIHLRRLNCHIYTIIMQNGFPFDNDDFSPFRSGGDYVELDPYGQGSYSFNCPVENHLIRFATDNPLACGDTLWTVAYSLDDDFTEKLNTKQYRFTLQPGEQMWGQSSLAARPLDCRGLIEARNKQ